MSMLRTQVAEYNLTISIVKEFLKDEFPGYSDRHFNVEVRLPTNTMQMNISAHERHQHVNGFYKFNIPSDVSEQVRSTFLASLSSLNLKHLQGTKEKLLKLKTSDDPYAPR